MDTFTPVEVDPSSQFTPDALPAALKDVKLRAVGGILFPMSDTEPDDSASEAEKEAHARASAARRAFKAGEKHAVTCMLKHGMLEDAQKRVDLAVVILAHGGFGFARDDAAKKAVSAKRWAVVAAFGCRAAFPTEDAEEAERMEEDIEAVVAAELEAINELDRDEAKKAFLEAKKALDACVANDTDETRRAYWDLVLDAHDAVPEEGHEEAYSDASNLVEKLDEAGVDGGPLAPGIEAAEGVSVATGLRALVAARMSYHIAEDCVPSVADAAERATLDELHGNKLHARYSAVYDLKYREASRNAEAESVRAINEECKEESPGSGLVAERVVLASDEQTIDTDANVKYAPTVLSYCEADRTVYVSSRGTRFTRDMREWLRDFRARLKEQNVLRLAGRKLHTGFAKSYVWQAEGVIAAIKELLGRAHPEAERVVFCGHSLGGAVATLLAAAWAGDEEAAGKPPTLVTFASPRVGDDEMHAFVRANTTCVRVWSRGDLVVWVPPTWLGYGKHQAAAHVQLAPGGRTRATDASPRRPWFFSFFPLWKLPFLGRHPLGSYQELLQKFVEERANTAIEEAAGEK